MSDKGNIWFCKIGESGAADLPPGSDYPMRQAVAEAYLRLTGTEDEFIFSGWGGELTEGERAVVDDRLPDPAVIASQERRKEREARKNAEDADAVAGTALPSPAPSGVTGERRWTIPICANQCGATVAVSDATPRGEKLGVDYCTWCRGPLEWVEVVPAERSDGPDVSHPSAGSGLEESATRKGVDNLDYDGRRDEGDNHTSGGSRSGTVRREVGGRPGISGRDDAPGRTSDSQVRPDPGVVAAQRPKEPVAGSGLVALDDVVHEMRLVADNETPDRNVCRAIHKLADALEAKFASPEGGGTE